MLLVLIALIALLAWGVYAFNRLIRLRNQQRTAWADIDVQLQRRHDLVPQLVDVVQAYAGHEAATLQAVTELRSQAMGLNQPGQIGEVEASLEHALGRLIALKEAYPDLKANQNFAQLQAELVKVEEHLQYARRFYNGAVRDYHDGMQRFPDLLVAKMGGFTDVAFFQAEADSRAAIKLELNP
ncbi:MAG: LemA family protein [Thermomonas sp.]